MSNNDKIKQAEKFNYATTSEGFCRGSWREKGFRFCLTAVEAEHDENCGILILEAAKSGVKKTGAKK